jgi:hypothetical protein
VNDDGVRLIVGELEDDEELPALGVEPPEELPPQAVATSPAPSSTAPNARVFFEIKVFPPLGSAGGSGDGRVARVVAAFLLSAGM